MNQTNVVLASLAALLLTACGGGNDSPPAATPSKMAPYVGKWESTCQDYYRYYLTITVKEGSQDTAIYTPKSEFFSEANCTGTVVATATYTSTVSATLNSSTTASIILAPGAAAITGKVDNITTSMPAYRVLLTGSGVTHPVVDGKPQWCIAYGAGTTCMRDELEPASEPSSESMYVSGNKMYVLFAGQSDYTVLDEMTRK